MNNIVGNGLLAQSLADTAYRFDDRYLVIASGVSNSKSATYSAFLRERVLISNVLEHARSKTVVYFSSNALGLYPDYPKTPYFKHKLMMEQLISSHSSSLILRLPQVVGAVSNSTLVSYFSRSLLAGDSIRIDSRSRRRLLGIADLTRIVTTALTSPVREDTNKMTYICPAYDISILELVESLASILNVPLPSLNLYDQGYEEPFHPDLLHPCISSIDPIMQRTYALSVLKSSASSIVTLINPESI